MPMYRKKLVVVKAWRFPERGCLEQNVPEWVREDAHFYMKYGIIRKVTVGLFYLDNGTANPGDWIVEGLNGLLRVYKDDYFHMTYEPHTTVFAEGDEPLVSPPPLAPVEEMSAGTTDPAEERPGPPEVNDEAFAVFGEELVALRREFSKWFSDLLLSKTETCFERDILRDNREELWKSWEKRSRIRS